MNARILDSFEESKIDRFNDPNSSKIELFFSLYHTHPIFLFLINSELATVDHDVKACSILIIYIQAT